MMKSAEEVEREVEASRGELDRTMEALKDKMTPGQLFDEATRAMGGAGQQVFSKFVEQARENPMPLAVMGLGLAWLMTSSNKTRYAPSSPLEPRSFSSDRGGASLGEVLHNVEAKASDAMSTVKDKASDAVAAAKEKLASATSEAGAAGRNLSASAGSAVEKAGAYGRQAQRGLMDALDREPLLIGGLAALVGAAIGAALPSTQVEDQMVGSTRDRLVDKGKDALQEGLEKAGEVAQSAYETVKSELHMSGDAAAAQEQSQSGDASQDSRGPVL
ncbi:MAG: DUF3618 domain-containing protein [Hyphomonadaceae bacterium]|nr:DUF3618 domain-containing protein [Hyphomonadaceae bacterium]